MGADKYLFTYQSNNPINIGSFIKPCIYNSRVVSLLDLTSEKSLDLFLAKLKVDIGNLNILGECSPENTDVNETFIEKVINITKHLKDEVQSKKYSKSDISILSHLVHDLNNILFLIMGYFELYIKKETTKNKLSVEEKEQILNNLKLSIDKLNNILDDNLIDIKLEGYIQRIINPFLFNSSVFKSNLEINLKSDIGNQVVSLRKKDLIRVIDNLINNSIKYSNVDSLEIDIILKKGDKSINIELKDNGEGIDEDVIDRVFDDLFTTRGTGMGLYTCKKIMKELKGDIIVKNNKGEPGVTFTIIIPTKT